MLERGHPAWLTRFANAVTNSTLKGAYIEVTATYLQRLCENADGRDLVSQLLEIWRNAGVRLVAIDVQSSDQVGLVNDLKIEYAIAPTASQ
jgi:EAL domain-containing protein (putative c-di-GMP-specific phosphodiesterase class I)